MSIRANRFKETYRHLRLSKERQYVGYKTEAELVQCPVRGFWQSGHNEIAKEGEGRISPYACHKNHHQLHEFEAFDEQPWKIIYVIRDPRDIVFSGMPYFFSGYRACKESKRIRTLIPDFVRYRFGGSEMIRRGMINAILHGDQHVHYWCRVSWKAHILPFLENPNVLKVKYEDLLDSPELQCRKILQHLDISRSPEEIQRAVSVQSFEAVRSRFRKLGDRGKSGFLRKGQTGYWQTAMPSDEQQRFEEVVGDLLIKLGYQNHTKPDQV